MTISVANENCPDLAYVSPRGSPVRIQIFMSAELKEQIAGSLRGQSQRVVIDGNMMRLIASAGTFHDLFAKVGDAVANMGSRGSITVTFGGKYMRDTFGLVGRLEGDNVRFYQITRGLAAHL